MDLPIEKPLRRGGYITNSDGERVWDAFKYEHLPTFCFTCGKLGHDDKHCIMVSEGRPLDCQYGKWLRAGGVSKGLNEEIKGLGSRFQEPLSGGDTGARSQSTAEDLDRSVQSRNGESQNLGRSNTIEDREKTRKKRQEGGWGQKHKQQAIRVDGTA